MLMDTEAIKALFREHHIPFCEAEVLPVLAEEQFPEEVNAYLRLMGKPVSIAVSEHGTPATYLMPQKELAEHLQYEEHQSVRDNGLLEIGSGANGDLLCIDLQTGHVGYVFHDELWEEPDGDFEEMHVMLDMTLEQFLQLALSGGEYPFDGFLAEEYHTK